MSAPVPDTPWRGTGAGGTARPGSPVSPGPFRTLRSLWLPLSDATPLHSLTLTSVLVLDVALVLLIPPQATGVLPGGPAIYLLLPAAAGLYMSLVALSARSPSRALAFRDLPSVLPLLALAGTLGLVILVALSGGPFGSVSSISDSSEMYPATLAGISLAIAGLWADGVLVPQPRWLRFGLLLLPPVLAGAARLPTWTDGALVVATSTTLSISAAVFLTSQLIPIPTRPASATRPPAKAPTLRPGLRSPSRPEGRSAIVEAVRSEDLPRVSGSSPVPSAPTTPSSPRSLGKWPHVVRTGFRWLDALLLGGFPRWGQIALVARSDPSGEVVIFGTLTEGLRRGEPVVIVSPPELRAEIAARFERTLPGFQDRDRSGRVLWVDVALGNRRGLPPDPAAGETSGMVDVLRSLHAVSTEAERRSPQGFCLGFFGLRTLFEAVGEAKAWTLVQNVVGILQARPTLVLYSIELGGPSDRAALRCANLLDGALLFRSTEGRSFVRVFRLGPVESRDWVETTLDPGADSLRLRARAPEP